MGTDDATRYGENALASLKRAGFTCLRVCCLGCRNWRWLRIDDAIAKLEPGASLFMVARRVRCQSCGVKGAHVEPEDPPAIGTPAYLIWAQVRRKWLLEELDQFKDLDSRLPAGG